MRITLIHNPDAGDDQSPSGDELIGLIHRAGYTVGYQSLKDENWPRILEEPCDIAAVAGGDGMVGQVAKHLIDRHIPIAVIPMGRPIMSQGLGTYKQDNPSNHHGLEGTASRKHRRWPG